MVSAYIALTFGVIRNVVVSTFWYCGDAVDVHSNVKCHNVLYDSYVASVVSEHIENSINKIYSIGSVQPALSLTWPLLLYTDIN